ncbi:autotransporter domain protein [Campylobacter porcelli]|uniref:Autotransporter domain protein n=4 Tax=Campylobacter TaxID=194 RepID=A0A1X9SUI2_9BACT|nr:autotransporter domain protein [Campylobacter sp. RM6137]
MSSMLKKSLISLIASQTYLFGAWINLTPCGWDDDCAISSDVSVEGVYGVGGGKLSINQGATITNSGSVTIYHNGDFDIENSGNIVFTENSSSNSGIYAFTTNDLNINNSGTIENKSSNKAAILVGGGGKINSITNSGTISSNGYGILSGSEDSNFGVDSIGKITNTGTISTTSGQNAIYGFGTIESIDNNQGGKITGINVSNTITNLNNYGIIEGNVVAKKITKLNNAGSISGDLIVEDEIESVDGTGSIGGRFILAGGDNKDISIKHNLGSGFVIQSDKDRITNETQLISNSAVAFEVNANVGEIINKNTIQSSANKPSLQVASDKVVKKLENQSTGKILGEEGIVNSGKIVMLDNLGDITKFNNQGELENLNNQKNISNLTNQSNIDKIDNSGNIADIKNQGQIDNLNNKNIITSIDNIKNIQTINNQGKIDRLNNQGSISSLDNKDKISNLANQSNIDKIDNSGNISNLINTHTITTLNNSNKIDNIDNQKDINSISNQSKITTINNQGSIDEIINEKDINNISNKHIIDSIKNQGKIVMLDNLGDITKFNNQGRLENLNNQKNISNLTNQSNIDKIDNSGNIADIKNQGQIDNLNNKNIITSIDNIKNIQTINNQGKIANLQNFKTIGGGKIGINNSNKIGSLINHGTITAKIGLDNSGVIDKIDNQGVIAGDKFGINNSSVISNLINSGTISGKEAAINNEGVIEKLTLMPSSKLLSDSQTIIKNSGIIGEIDSQIQIDKKTSIVIDNDSVLSRVNIKTDMSGLDYGVKNSGEITDLIINANLEGENHAGISNNNTISKITNSSTLSGYNGIYNDNYIGTIENNGTIISHSSTAIYNDGTIDKIDNNGKIVGDIINNSPNTIKQLINSGEITGNMINNAGMNVGLYTQDKAIENKGKIAGIINHGTIRAKKYGIYNDIGANISNLANYGKIIFKDQNGAQIYNNGNIDITMWGISLGGTSLSSIDTTNGNANIDDRIFVAGDNVDGIKFGNNSIIVSSGSSTGGVHALDNMVLKHNGTSYIGVGDEIGINCDTLVFNNNGIMNMTCITLAGGGQAINIISNKAKVDIPRVWINNHTISSNTHMDILRKLNLTNFDLSSDDWVGFATPYASHTKLNLQNGKATTNTYGALIGASKTLDIGAMVALYTGYEYASTNMPRSSSLDDRSYYTGVSYYGELNLLDRIDAYVKLHSAYKYTKSKIVKLDEARTTTLEYLNSDRARLSSIGASAALGVNIYQNNNTISPELSLGYDRINISNYTLGYEEYAKSHLNLPNLSASIAWQKDYENIYTTAKIGVKRLLSDTHKTALKYQNLNMDKADTKLINTYIDTSLALGCKVDDNTNLSIIYYGNYANEAKSHSIMAQMESKF